eukprot:TRINITY_DN4869_c0_g1_i2.p1 TRINITY_DN4869_c0_g1~~TRINITY_DN4869_c0_g1_i2.p1  ORF type:complete len:455 (-),score=133.18 TRINITY_DN4869_c0_g1_i2:112-1407(-)
MEGKDDNSNNNKSGNGKPKKYEVPGWTEKTIHPIVEESAFATLFPKYREKYLMEVWPLVKKELESYGIHGDLDLSEGSMTVKTSRKTSDPYCIMKARDLIRLLARGVPYSQALKIFNDDVNCDIIKIGGFVRNKERFVKRRSRLIGPNGTTLKAIELLTNTYIMVQGTTVTAMGTFDGLTWVRKIAEDCMKNLHPVYAIKELMVRRELAKDPTLAGEDWSRFLPKYKRRQIKKKKAKEQQQQAPPRPAQPQTQTQQKPNEGSQEGSGNNVEEKTQPQQFQPQRQNYGNNNFNNRNATPDNKKRLSRREKEKRYTPFPPEPTPRIIDKQLASGEYFLSENKREARERTKKQQEKEMRNLPKHEEKQRKIEKSYTAPEEQVRGPLYNHNSSPSNTKSTKDTIHSIKSNLSNMTTKRKSPSNPEDFVLSKKKKE